MHITRFNHVGLNGKGMLDELREFYRDFLGLDEFERVGAATTVNGLWSGRQEPIVHMVTDPAEGIFALPNNTHLSFYVDDIDDAVAQVKEKYPEALHVGERDRGSPIRLSSSTTQ